MGLCLEENKICLTSSGWDYYYYYYYFGNLKHNVSLNHVTSVGLMTPRPVGFRALGVETPLRA